MAGTEIGSIFVKIGADTKELNSGLKQTEQGLKSVGDNADSASQDLKKLAERALIDSLKDMSNALGGISSTIISFGKDIAGAAMQAENFRIAMTTAFQGNQEAADKMLQWAKDFANATPFETNEIVEATIKLKAYGFTAEQIPDKLRQIGDMASGMGKTMDQAVEALADASTGELERLKEFGITKKMLNDEVNGTLVNSKNQITDMNLLMESLSSIMEKRFAGGMEAASKSTAGQISNLKGEFQALKEELGNELLPTINDTVKSLTDLTKWVREIDPEIKKTTLTFAGWTAAIALAGKAIADIAVVLTPVIGAIGGLSAIVVTAGVGLGALANATIEYKKSVVELQKTDLENSTKREAEAVKALAEAFRGATTPQQAFFKAMQEGIENILKSEDGLIRIKALLTSSVQSEMAQVKEMNNLQKEKGSLETQLANVKSKNKDGDIALLNEQEAKLKAEIADTDRLIKQKREYIKEMREERKTIYEIQKAHKEEKEAVKETTEKQKVSKDAMKEYWVQYNSISVNEKKTAKEKIETLKSLLNQYDLTNEQRAKVNKEIQKQEDKIAKYITQQNKKRVQENKKNLQEQTADWNNYYKDLQIALRDNEIDQGTYQAKIKQYEKDHNITRETNEKLWLQMENAYSQEAVKIKQKEIKEKKKEESEYKKELREYAKEELAREKEEAAQKVALRKTILAEQEALEKAAMGGKSPAEQYELEIEFMNKRIALQESLVASEAKEGELFKLRLDSGQDLKSTELKTLEIYIKDKAALQQMNNEYSGIVDKAAQAQRQEIENYRTYEQLLVQTGKITQAEADKAMGFFEQRVSNGWKNYITPIIKQATEQGYNSLNEMQKKALGSAKDFIKANITATDNLTTGMDNVTNSTNRAADASARIKSNLESSTEQADDLANKMRNIGNIAAGRNPYGGGGEFLSTDEALSNLISKPQKYGHLDQYSDAVRKSMQRETSGGGIYGTGEENPYSYLNPTLDTANPYIGLGLGTIQPSENPNKKTPGNAGSGSLGNMPSVNIPSFATPAGSSSAGTAISNTNKTNANIAFNFGDSNVTNNMPQNVADASKTMTNWALAVQMRGARS